MPLQTLYWLQLSKLHFILTRCISVKRKSMSSDLTRPSAGQIGGDKLSFFYHLWAGEEE